MSNLNQGSLRSGSHASRLNYVSAAASARSLLCNTNIDGPGLPPTLSVQEEPGNLCDGNNGTVLGWLASEHITGLSTLHAAEADDPKMHLQRGQQPTANGTCFKGHGTGRRGQTTRDPGTKRWSTGSTPVLYSRSDSGS